LHVQVRVKALRQKRKDFCLKWRLILEDVRRNLFFYMTFQGGIQGGKFAINPDDKKNSFP